MRLQPRRGGRPMQSSLGGETKFCCREPDLLPAALKHCMQTGGYAVRTRSKEVSTALRWSARPGSPPIPRSCGGGTKFCCREPDLSPPALKHFVKTGGYTLRARSKELSTAVRWSARPGSPPMPRSCGGGTKFCCREPDLSPPALKHFVKTGGYTLRTRSKELSTALRWSARPGSPPMPRSCGGGTKFAA